MAAPNSNAILEAALAYAAAGWPVFPCDPRIDPPGTKRKRSKAPLVAGADKDEQGKPIPKTGGLWRATTDEQQIRQWWARWPGALIGLPTGSACGAFVVDFDPDDKNGSLAEIKTRLVEQVGPLRVDPGPVSRTQSDGRHLWYALPPGTEIPPPRSGLHGADGEKVLGVDVRGEGGYVIVPPSVMASGRDYRWVNPPAMLGGPGVALPQPPAELLDFVLQRGRFARKAKHAAAAAPVTAPPSDDQPSRGGDNFFARVNTLALRMIEAWAPQIFPSGRAEPGTGAWRVASRDLGRDLQEDLSIHPEGIRDFGTERTLTAIDLVIEHGGAADAAQAALWLCRQLGATPESLGWRALQAGRPRPAAPGPETPSSQAAAGTSDSGTPEERSGQDDPGGRDERGGPPDDAEIDPATLRRCAGYPLNDSGNGHRLRAHFGAEFIGVREVGPHLWTGSHWEPEGAKDALLRLAQETAQRIGREGDVLDLSEAALATIEAARDLDREVMLKDGRSLSVEEKRQKAAIKAADRVRARFGAACQDYADWAVASGMAPRLRAMIDCALAHCTEAPEALDAEPLAVNLANGTLRLVKERVREEDPDCPDPEITRYVESVRWRVRLDAHRRSDRFAKVLGVTYDPEADCPKWRAFVERFQPKPPLRRFLQAFHGYALTGLTGEQVFVFNFGHGANGKSTFMEALARLMGPYAQVLPVEAITGDSQRRGDQATPEFARLPGARLVRCAELPRGQGFRETTLKMLTGGEPILVRHLHQGFFEFRPRFKVIGSGNSKPHIGGVDEGIWRRMRLVPWEVTIPDAEQRPMERVLRDFAAEAPGILNWLLEGLVDYLTNGLVVPAEIQSATGAYRNEMDPVGEFLNACVVAALEESVTARDLYNAYADWCAANSVKPFAEKTFASIMGEKGYAKESGRIRRYLDIRLNDVPLNPDRDPGAWGGPQY